MKFKTCGCRLRGNYYNRMMTNHMRDIITHGTKDHILLYMIFDGTSYVRTHPIHIIIVIVMHALVRMTALCIQHQHQSIELKLR